MACETVHGGRLLPPLIRGGWGGWIAKAILSLAAIVNTLAGAAARADVFYLTTGATIEGDLVDETGEKVRVMLTNGPIVLTKHDVVRREPTPTTLQRYAAEKAKHPDTAQGNYDLGAWCDRNGLAAEARTHYRAAIAKDPALTAAYHALGYVAVGDAWLDGSSAASQSRTAGGGENASPLLDEILNGWLRRLRGIRYSYLEPPSHEPGREDRRVSEGLDQIRAIKDPLAIPAMVRVLSPGPYRARQALVEVLGRFAVDEATLNLLAISLLDPDPLIRSAAATTLVPRKDPRIEAQLRRALRSNDDELMPRAATALGVLKARSAVGDLIPRLTSTGRGTTATSQGDFCTGLTQTFDNATVVELGGQRLARSPAIAIAERLGPGASGGAARTGARTTTTNRPEVLQALKAITGQDFGFDVDAWKRWDRQNPSTRP
jgi:Arc/MetJ family transcription regulator